MEKIYSETFALRTSDFDCRGHIKPSAVLDLFQEAAGVHAGALGVGFDDLMKKQLLWVLVKVKYQVLNNIKRHQRVVVKTWPLKPSRIVLERDYLIEDEKGNVLVKGTSQWVTIHSEKRKFVPSPDIYPFEDFCEDRTFEEKFSKNADFDSEDAVKKITPSFCELDMNGHVNNIRYADYVLNCLDLKDEAIESFQLDFHKEVYKDMPVSIYIEKSDGQILAKGANEQGERMFSASLCLKK